MKVVTSLPMQAYAALRALKQLHAGGVKIDPHRAKTVWEENQPWFDRITQKLAELDGEISVHETNYAWLEAAFGCNAVGPIAVCHSGYEL